MMHMNTNPQKEASKEGMYAQLGENSRRTRDNTIGTHTAKEAKRKRKIQEEGGSQCKNEKNPFGDGAG